MKFEYSPELLAHMKKAEKNCMLVELVEANSSDLEITELHVWLIDQKTRDVFLNKKDYRSVPTDAGEVLLPPFPLTIDETVQFGLKKFLFFKWVSYTGIKI